MCRTSIIWWTTPAERAKLIQTLQKLDSFCFDTETTSLDPKEARLVGLAFSFAPHTGYYVPVPQDAGSRPTRACLDEFRPVLESERIEKVGHNLKFDLSVLKWQGVSVRGKLFDTMVAHSLIEPEMRHGMDYLSEVYLGYTPIPISKLIGDAKAEPDQHGRCAGGQGGRVFRRGRRRHLATPRRARAAAQAERARSGCSTRSSRR